MVNFVIVRDCLIKLYDADVGEILIACLPIPVPNICSVIKNCGIYIHCMKYDLRLIILAISCQVIERHIKYFTALGT